MSRYTSTKPGNDVRWYSMPTRWLLGAALALCLNLPALVAADVHPYERWAEKLGIDLSVSYDGTRVMEMKEGKFEAIERRAPGKMYTEIHMSGMSSGVILREDLNKSYVLMPSMGYYKEETLDDGMMQTSNGMEFTKIEKVGREDIIGHPSTKYKTRFKDNEGKGAGIIWVTDSGVPIKMDMIYSNSDMKGERISIQFIELNLRAQDPAVFELPPNLKPMNMGNMADIMKMATAQGAASSSTSSTASASDPGASSRSNTGLSDKQQACLQEATARAAQEREKAEQKKGFGRLMGSLTRTARRFGLTELSEVSSDIYEADATAEDVSVIAEELGISEEDVERCRQP